MTVNANPATVSYNGADSPGPFAIPFYFLADSHVVVTKTVDGVATTVPDTDYTLTGAGDEAGGSLLLDDDLATGESIDIDLVPTFDQQSEYGRNDPFPAEVTERALDKLTMLSKYLRGLLAALRADFDAVDLTEINSRLDSLESSDQAQDDAIAIIESTLSGLQAANDLRYWRLRNQVDETGTGRIFVADDAFSRMVYPDNGIGTYYLPADVFQAADEFVFVNDSTSNVNIIPNNASEGGTAPLTLYLAGQADTGNRVIPAHSIARFYIISPSRAYIDGVGMTP
jgi:hypothetical protein